MITYKSTVESFSDETALIQELSGVEQHPIQYYEMSCPYVGPVNKKFIVQFIFDTSKSDYQSLLAALPAEGEKIEVFQKKILFLITKYDINLPNALRSKMNFIRLEK